MNPDLQKEISDMRDELAQQIGSRLQAELVAAPAKSVGGVATSTGAGGNLAGQNSGNAPGNSSAQDTANQSAAATASGAGSHAVDASDATTSGPNAVAGAAPGADLAAELKTAAQLVPAADSVAHVSLDVAAPAASAAAVSTSSPPVASASSNTSVMRPAPLPETLPQSLSDVVKASELYQRVGGSEMHIAMQTDLLGAVDLRAAMHQSTLTATISVQRSDVQALLANELPALQHALADRNFHVEQITVLNNSVGGRSGSNGQQPSPQQNSPGSRGLAASRISASSAIGAEDSAAMFAGSSAYGASGESSGSGRISVHV